MAIVISHNGLRQIYSMPEHPMMLTRIVFVFRVNSLYNEVNTRDIYPLQCQLGRVPEICIMLSIVCHWDESDMMK